MASSFWSLTRVAMTLRISVTAAGVAVLASACGGSAFTGGVTDDGGASHDGSTPDGGGVDGGTSDSGSGDASGDGGIAPTCPAASGSGAACTQEGLQCEYGDDPNAGCEVVDVCQSGAFKTASSFVSEPKTCPTPTPAKENKCPATYALVPVGQAC